MQINCLTNHRYSIFFFFLFISILINAQEYLVVQNKLDSILSNSSPGDTIVLADGTYNDIVLNLKSSGTKNKPIVLKSSTIGGVVFTGPLSRISVQASYCVIDGFEWRNIKSVSSKPVIQFTGASNNVFKNNTIVNSGRITEGSKTGILRLRENSQNNIIEYNRFDNLLNLGIQVWAYDSDNSNTGNVIRYNYFVNHKKFEIIQLGQGGASAFINQYSIVENNLFENVDMVDPELISSKTSYNSYLHNTFRNCRSMLVLRTGQNALVEGNWFFNSHGIRVHDKNHIIINNYIEGGPVGDSSVDNEGIVLYCGTQFRPEIGDLHYPADSVLIVNNTIINHMAEHILVGKNSVSWQYKPTSVIIKNNLIVNNVGTAILNEASINSVWEQNIVFPSGSGIEGNVDNVINKDPLLVFDGGVYKLKSTSPAIDAAMPDAALTSDIEGQVRNIPDIGADEFSDKEILYMPLDSTMVGPGNEEVAVPTWIRNVFYNQTAATFLRNYPNPFTDITIIEFEIPFAGNVELEVYDLNGAKIKTLINQYLPAGKHSYSWKACDDKDLMQLKSGIYYCRLKTPYSEQSNKLFYLKQH